MFRRLILIIAASTLLWGCTGSSLADLVKEVQDKAVAICKYLPEANSVAAMLTAANPSVTGAGAIAQAICTAVTTYQNHPSSLTSECPKVNGICVQGDFKKG